MGEKFSVLMSIYHKEKAVYFHRAMQSIWDEQTTKPNEIVLVQDGELPDELSQCIDEWKNKLKDSFRVVALKHHVGTGNALNTGLKQCRYPLIAGMDSDDISLKDRFTKQLAIFKTHQVDVVSAWVGEFKTDENHISSYRKLPQYHSQIIQFSKKRSPINHPAIMYKKSIIERVGGYPDRIWLEDYYLCVKLALGGAKFYNIQTPLVNMRIQGQFSRRRGLRYAISEYHLQKDIFELGFINVFEFIRNIILRFTVRIMPKKIVAMIYKKLR